MKKQKSRIISFIMALFITVTTVFGNVSLAWAEDETVTYASWNYTSSASTVVESLVNNGETDTSSGTLTIEKNSTSAKLTSEPKCIKATGVMVGDAIVFTVNDVSSATNVYFGAKLLGSNTAAKYLKLEYAYDDNEFTTLKDDKNEDVIWQITKSEKAFEASLPNTSNGKKLVVKLTPAKNARINGETAIGNTGTISMNSIVFASSKPASESASKPKCSAPTANPTAGEVEAGTKVTLSTKTEGATVYYNFDDSKNFIKYESPIEINEPTTIYCYASTNTEDVLDSAKKTFNYTIKAAAQPAEEVIETYAPATTIEDGDKFFLYSASASGVMSTKASGTRLSAVAATPEVGKLAIPEGTALLVAEKNENGYFTFSCDGKYLTTGATGNSLSFTAEESDLNLWEVITEDGYVNIKSVKAVYNNKAQYIEYFKTFTTYTFTAGEAAFKLVPYVVAKHVKNYQADTSIDSIIATWGTTANYDAANVSTVIYGDRYAENDMADTAAEFTAVVNNKNAKTYSKATSSTTGSTNYYMGATGLGSGANDYMQIKVSSVGMTNMKLTTSLRASNTSCGEFQMQYSTDGEHFVNITDGTYAYGYTPYNSDGTPGTPVSKSGAITDGIAKTSYNPGSYVDFTFDLPMEASNADTLYIRFVAKKVAAKDGSNLSSNGVVRIRTLVLEGNPIVDPFICDSVSASLASGGVPTGAEVVLSTKTDDANIFYSINGAEYVKYEGAIKLTTLPAVIMTYATKDGLGKSATLKYSYTQEQCANALITPNGGAILKSKKIKIKTTTEDATILYAVVADKDTEVLETQWQTYTGEFALTSFPATVKTKVVKAGCISSAISTATFTEKSNDSYNIYFGQIHAHTNFSDGAGSCEEAYQYALKVDNLDYIAITDHSNSFDNSSTEQIDVADTNQESEWNQGHALAEKYTTADFTCIYGYEMTWSNGLGHMNTFNTPGYQDRVQTAYSSYGTALQNYYAALNKVTDSISMFNHPGTTFGDFSDFAYFTEENDSLINLIEVGNGEGAIGSSGYFPSYEYYTRALDKGWHVAPTNNQDNHKGKWGDANTARTVVLADANNEEAIYDAMRNHRVYATEDNNLSIYYTLDGNVMGTIMEKDEVGDTVKIKVDLKDADNEKIGKVEVIVNGGLSIASKTVTTGNEVVTFDVPANYSYYYIKVTEADGDIAVTAPVWVGEVEACGINGSNTTEVLPVRGEELDINVDLYNNEKTALEVDKIEVSVDGEVIISVTGEKAGVATIASNSTGTASFKYTYNGVGSVEYNITVYASLDGVDKVYKDVLKLSYTAPSMVTNVIIDGTHYNDYVTGYYGGNITNFIKLAGDQSIRASVVTDKITKEMLDECALLVISAPAKKNGTANAGDFKVSHFEDDFIAMVADYVANGGNVVLCGMADYQDTTDCQTATEMNKLLEAIGATIRINSDEAYDEVNNGGQAYRLYPSTVNMNNKFMAGVVEGQTYSQYSGCTINITNATESDIVYAAEALVSGFDTTYSIDCKTDTGAKANSGVYVEKGNVVFLAHQATKAGGNIFAAGGIFLSDFEVKAEIDNADSLPYINYTVAQNILKSVKVELEATPIAEVRHAKLGEIFAVEGYVTNGTANAYTTFFDSIYIQDETGGIDIFPYAELGLEIGTKVRIVGYVDEYQGDRELQVMSATVLDAPHKVIAPLELSTKDSMNYDVYGGRLLKTTGIVTRVEYTSDGKGVSEFWIKDESGKEASIFIDGYIYSATTGKNELASFVKVGAKVSAVGVLYKHPEGESDESVPVFRVRNCDEIVLVQAAGETASGLGNDKNNTSSNPFEKTEETNNGLVTGNTTNNGGNVLPVKNDTTDKNAYGDVTEEVVTEPEKEVQDNKDNKDDKESNEVVTEDKDDSAIEASTTNAGGSARVLVFVFAGTAVVAVGAGAGVFLRRRGKNA